MAFFQRPAHGPAPQEDQTDFGRLRHLFDAVSSTNNVPYSRYWHGYVCAPAAALPVHLHQPANAPSLRADGAFSDGAADGSARLTADHPGLCGFVVFVVPPALGICLQYVPVSLIALLSVFTAFRAGNRRYPEASIRPFRADQLVRQLLRLLTFPVVSLSFP